MPSVLSYALGLDTGGFTGPLAGARKSLQDFGNLGNVLTGIKSAFSLAGDAIRAMVAPIKDAVDAAADFEQIRNQFITLLGTVDKAEQRLKELSQFADSTPFELTEVANASRVLETLTHGAFSTGEALTLVGDVASGTGQPFQELAMWVGRLYDGLMNNRPVGEALMRMSELGVISGDVRDKLEHAAGGAQAWDIAKEALGRFTGNMERQSFSWKGLMSTLGDAWHLLQREFGQPIMDAFKPMLERGIAALGTMKEKAKELGETFAVAGRMLIMAFETGQAGDIVGKSLKLGMLEAIDLFHRGWVAAVAGGAVFLSEAIKGALDMLTSGDVWSGIGHALNAAFYGAIEILKVGMADVMEGLGLGKAAKAVRASTSGDKMNAFAEGNLAAADFKSANASKVFDTIEAAIPKAAEAAARAWNASPENEGIGSLKAELGHIFDDLRGKVAEARKGEKQTADEREKRIEDKAAAARNGGASPEYAVKPLPPQSDNLAKIGGFIGGSSQQHIDYARRTAGATEKAETHLQKMAVSLSNTERESHFNQGGATWSR